MKLIILNSKSRFRSEDLSQLESAGAIFYETKSTKLSDIKELSSGEDIILGVQPSWLEGSWEGLEWEKIKKYPNIKGICLSTTAYGWVPFTKLAKIGVPVTNVPGKSTDAVGEYYVMMMLALLRKLPLVIKNNWQFSYSPELLGRDASGLIAGIVGLGNIGMKIAKLCQGFDMTVIYWSKHKKKCSFEYLPLQELCQQVDVLFITTVADESTKNLINQSLISTMKPTAVILSPIDPVAYDREFILNQVDKGQLGGFGFESDDKTTLDFEGNVFAAPEIGYYTQQTLDRESAIMTEAMLGLLASKPQYVVNM